MLKKMFTPLIELEFLLFHLELKHYISDYKINNKYCKKNVTPIARSRAISSELASLGEASQTK